jgi:peptidyl-tRNA hydrolase
MNQTRDLAVYVLARTDLASLNSGKLAAQVHHAGVQMINKHRSQQLVQDYVTNGIQQGADNFNTTIVLGATLSQIQSVSVQANQLDTSVVVSDTVLDPSYPFFVQDAEVADLIPETVATAIKQMADGRILMTRSEVTCAWFVGDRNDARFRMLFDGLDLHP